ncbi:MAG TPA: AbiV family abortive infection protein [Rhizomicrobium sp.]|nr:AbiV family abortive infection protein [Rhizomicrobium sp.]
MTDEQKQAADETKMHHAMDACITSARNLVESAKAVLALGKSNIAYHLATAALEELGKRELFAVRMVASTEVVPPSWPEKHAQDHVHKLFWCFFGPSFYETLTRKALEDMRQLARTIHDKRKGGLYVESDEDGVHEPHDAITPDDAQALVSLAEARLSLAAAQERRTPTQTEMDDQAWFLRTASDPRTRNMIMSAGAIEKLSELKDAKAWVKWLKEQFEKASTDGLAAIQVELQRSKSLPEKPERDKWRVRVRLISDSHSVRPGTLKTWNDHSQWIKLLPAPPKKNQLFLELTLGDNIPIEGVWWFAWGVARHFVTALNIGSMGFWWWRMPEQVNRFYESIVDLDQPQMEIAIERNPSLKIDWGENRALSQDDLARTAMAFAALPGPGQREKHAAFNYYIGGITFLSLNDVHWQCEIQAFGNFYLSLKEMMKDVGDWDGTSPFETPMLKFLDELFPGLEERDRFSELCRAFDTGEPLKPGFVTLRETSFIKLFCDAYFMRRIQPAELRDLEGRSRNPSDTDKE